MTRVGALPTGAADTTTKYIYLTVFPSALKIGVSGSLYSRISVLQSKRREKLERVYFVLLSGPEALRREAIIKRKFGPQTIGRRGLWTGFRSEWLDRADLGAALGIMAVQELAAAAERARLDCWMRRPMAEAA